MFQAHMLCSMVGILRPTRLTVRVNALNCHHTHANNRVLATAQPIDSNPLSCSEWFHKSVFSNLHCMVRPVLRALFPSTLGPEVHAKAFHFFACTQSYLGNSATISNRLIALFSVFSCIGVFAGLSFGFAGSSTRSCGSRVSQRVGGPLCRCDRRLRGRAHSHNFPRESFGGIAGTHPSRGSPAWLQGLSKLHPENQQPRNRRILTILTLLPFFLILNLLYASCVELCNHTAQ